MYRHLSGQPISMSEATDIKVSLTENEYDDRVWGVSLIHAPMYQDGTGIPYVYYVKQNTDIVKPSNGEAEYREFLCNVDNYTSKEEGLFDGGTLRNTLAGKEHFTVTKVWLDGQSGETVVESRPSTYVVLMRVEEGKAIEDASPVQGYDSAPVTKKDGDVTLGIVTVGEGEGAVSYDNLPKYDFEG